MGNRPEFDGEVQPGRKYIIVDDVVARGGSLSELRHYIESRGGEVVEMTTMGYSQFGTKIALTKETKLALEQKYGYNELREFLKREGIYGGEHAALTESEGRTLLRVGSLESAGNRIAEARLNRVGEAQPGVARKESPGSSTQKVDDDTQAMRPVNKSAAAVADEQLKSIIDEVPTRVKLDPLPKPPKYKATSTRRIVLQLQRGLKKGIHIGRTPQRSLGVHSKASGKIIIRFSGDIDATAHEIGHNLDHARTRTAGYRPPVYWEPIGQVRARLGIPIVANGDIWDLDGFKLCRDQTGGSHFMIGRGALANPRLSHEIATELGLEVKNPDPGSVWDRHFCRLVARAGTDIKTLHRLKQWMSLATKHGTFEHFDLVKRATSVTELLAVLDGLGAREFVPSWG